MVFDFFGAEAGDHLFEVGFFFVQLGELLGVMFINHGFHGDGAGHGSFGAEQGGGRAQREACDMPDRLQGGGAYLAGGDQLVEGGEVGFFLRGHMLDDGESGFGFRAVLAFQDGDLTGVDAFGAIFTGLVYADHFFECLGFGEVAGLTHKSLPVGMRGDATMGVVAG